jgi:hypothetical protein
VRTRQRLRRHAWTLSLIGSPASTAANCAASADFASDSLNRLRHQARAVQITRDVLPNGNTA